MNNLPQFVVAKHHAVGY